MKDTGLPMLPAPSVARAMTVCSPCFKLVNSTTPLGDSTLERGVDASQTCSHTKCDNGLQYSGSENMQDCDAAKVSRILSELVMFITLPLLPHGCTLLEPAKCTL